MKKSSCWRSFEWLRFSKKAFEGSICAERPRRIRPACRAFTLIELLVVIAIIALLAAMLMAATERARMSARRAVCTSNFRQMATGLTLYAGDNEGALSWRHGVLWYVCNYGTNGSTWHFPRDNDYILMAMEQYDFGPATAHPEVGSPPLNAPGNFWDPETMTLAQRQGSDNCPYSFIWGFSWRHAAPPFQITAPGPRRVMMTDFTFDAPSQGFTCYAHPKDSPQEKMVARDFGANYNTAYQFFQDDSANIGGRGMEAVGGTHVLFFDGSVAWYKPDDLEPWWGHGGATMVPADATYGPP